MQSEDEILASTHGLGSPHHLARSALLNTRTSITHRKYHEETATTVQRSPAVCKGWPLDLTPLVVPTSMSLEARMER